MLRLPGELLTHVLSFLEAEDVCAFGRTCWKANKAVEPANTTLWKQIFLNSYDDPFPRWALQTPTPGRADKEMIENWKYQWFEHLRERRTVAKLINQDDPLDLTADYTDTICVLLNMIETARARPSAADIARGVQPQTDDRRSLNLDVLVQISDSGRVNLNRIIHARQMEGLAASSTDRRLTRSATSVREQPDGAARLHVLHGMTPMEQEAPRLRGHGRRLVYDWSLTGATTDYGPFKLDGSGEVNWQLLEGVCSTISRNFYRCADGRTIMPEGFQYSIPYRSLDDPTVPDDWAGAQGSWLGTYAFLDYADLYQFNLGHRHGERPTLEDEPEACGDLMRLDLKLDPSLRTDYKLKTDLPICSDLPLLYFSGESKGHDGAYRPSIGVRGTASLVPGGKEVRWRFLINYGGEDQWQLEGVQAGGIRSGGIYGLWSHCAHAENGPVGPFCYFPLELCKPTALARVRR